MARRKQDYRIKLSGYRNGLPFFDLHIVGQRKFRLSATDKMAAEAEAKLRYAEVAAEIASRPAPPPKPKAPTLRQGVEAYLESDEFKRYKPLTVRQRQSMFRLILASPTSTGRSMLGDVELTHWVHHPDAPEAIMVMMAACKEKAEAARRRLLALDSFFRWLLSKGDHQAIRARADFGLNLKTMRNPCKGIEKPERKGGGGHQPLADDQIEDWLKACEDDREQHRAVRLMQMLGPRISDMHRLHRGMIKETDVGRVLTWQQEKGKDSEYREQLQP